MARTLVEAGQLCQDKLVSGVIEEIINTEAFMGMLPFEDLTGNALGYNREDAANPPSMQWHQVNGVWVESTGKTTPHTVALKILGGDADTDNFIQQTRSNINDQHATDIRLKAKALANEAMRALIYGTTVGTDEFMGLHGQMELMSAAELLLQDIYVGVGAAAEGPLSMLALDQAIDQCRYGADFILLSKMLLRYITRYLRSVGSYETTRDAYGNLWPSWRGVPFVATDWITDTEDLAGSIFIAGAGTGVRGTGGTGTSIFVGHFGEQEGLTGLQNGNIWYDHWLKLESKNSRRTRLGWYLALCLYSTRALVRIGGVDPDGAVTA